MHKTKYRIAFYDCDPAGIIFFANLLRIAHNSYELFMKEINQYSAFSGSASYILPIKRSEADYIKPIKHDDEISITIETAKLGRTSFELEYRISDEEGNNMAMVKTLHVSVDKKTFRKIELPRDLLRGLTLHLKK